jgi:hypothetical protein
MPMVMAAAWLLRVLPPVPLECINGLQVSQG